MTTDIALYVHIPYCKSKCNYCDFCSFKGNSEESEQAYFQRISEEISAAPYREGLRVSSVFFGGGTPTVFSSGTLADILALLSKKFTFLENTEITVEANPGTVTLASLKELKEAGFNRISFGLQSIHENELKKLGRIHTFDVFFASYRLAREAGFDNVNVDLMYGIPYQTLSSFKETLQTLTELRPEHISVYGLIIEEGTPFYRERDRLALPSEDEEYEMYLLASEILSKSGYAHYEISNYALKDRECKHNLTYWLDREYLGFGLSAHSYFDGKRFSNSSDLTLYMRDEGREVIALSDEDNRFEYAMLALRLSRGIVFSEYETKFGESFLSSERLEKLKKYEKGGFVKITPESLFLTERGFYISNTVLSDIL